jgi:S-adenosylhomocysteine hydrolase
MTDKNLIEKGQKRIEWAERDMPVLKQVREQFAKDQPLKGKVLAAVLHVTCETANLVRALKAGGAEAFDDRFYWSSTQHASHSDFAWGQHFGGGNQSYRYGWLTGSQLRARAVRRLEIQ